MPSRLTPMTAADIMTPSPRTCSPFSTVLEAVMIFRDADCGAVPVVEAGTPVGIVTDRDVALALATYPDLITRPVSDIMTRGAVAVAPTATLEELRSAFTSHEVRRVLVADPAAQQLLGIVAWADVAPYVSDHALGEIVTEVVQKS